MFDYTGKTVLITGAGGGIGRGLCEAFLQWNAVVLAVDNDADALHAIADHGGRLRTSVFDVTDLAAVRQAVGALVAGSAPVDVLINNAGGAAATALCNLTPEGWSQDIALNLTGAYNCVEAVKSDMLARNAGVVINIGSVNAMLALGHPAYSAAKAGLASYTRSLAVELGPKGIRANLIAPGTVKTQAWTERAQKNPEIFASLRRWYPLREFATPGDIAAAAGFLASDVARMITGVVLPVDGGLTAGNPVMAAELTLESF